MNPSSETRIVSADRGGFSILYRGATYWARTYALAVAVAEVLECE